MTWQHDTMMNPPIEGLLERADSKFRLVTLSALIRPRPTGLPPGRTPPPRPWRIWEGGGPCSAPSPPAGT